jgi:hypothetical protein
MPYCDVKGFKMSNFKEFWTIDRTWPTLDKFFYSHFICENSRYFRGLYKIWTKLFHLTWKKKVKCKTGHGKSEEKGEFWESLEWIPRT